MNNYSEEITREFLKEYNRLDAIKENEIERYEYYESQYRNLFHLLSSCRNSLSHNTIGNGYPFLVSDSLVKDLKSLLNKMETKAFNIMVPLSKIKTVNENTSIGEVVNLMHQNGYSYLPILNFNHQVTHIVSEKSIIAILDLWKDKDASNFKNYHLQDFLSYFKLDNSSEIYYFISKNEFASSTKVLFSKISNNKKCKLILVTEHGESKEGLLGLITPRDVMNF